MGRASKGEKTRKKEHGASPPIRSVPNCPLLGLALIGVGITGYLTVVAWSGKAVAGCPMGSGCDVVLSSRWSNLFGLPISLWGFLTYLSVAAISFIRRPDAHWKMAWTLSLFGVLYSAYLTTVSIVRLEATCPYCLTSAGLLVAILATVLYQRPRDLKGFSWTPWLVKTFSGAIALVLAIHLSIYSGFAGKPGDKEDPWTLALAEHLAKGGAKFYGAYWCPHCQEQKGLFGASAHRLPYIECSPGGRRAPQASICRVMSIRSYPTWIINGRRYEGLLTLEQLAHYSKFEEHLAP
ncbi:MAG: vitamin K epoxide reductase family protein [Candidatus Binatia bacterium]